MVSIAALKSLVNAMAQTHVLTSKWCAKTSNTQKTMVVLEFMMFLRVLEVKRFASLKSQKLSTTNQDTHLEAQIAQQVNVKKGKGIAMIILIVKAPPTTAWSVFFATYGKKI